MDNERRWNLYRCFDADDQLLYIGQTANWTKRRQHHASQSSWWPLVDRVEMQSDMEKAEALEAERLAIFREQPIHNVEGKLAPRDLEVPPPRPAVHFVSTHEAGLMLGIGRTTIYDYVHSGDLHLVHHGRRSVVAVREIDQLAARLAAEAGIAPDLLAG
jgi:predicted GIY-YIG superfamily endonuclease